MRVLVVFIGWINVVAALQCYNCKYWETDDRVIEGSKDCFHPVDSVATVTCPSNVASGYEYRCFVEDVSYELELVRYRVVHRSCQAVSTSLTKNCSTESDSDIWKQYGQYKSESSRVNKFLDAVRKISGNVCYCKGDKCNTGNTVQIPIMLILIAVIMARIINQ